MRCSAGSPGGQHHLFPTTPKNMNAPMSGYPNRGQVARAAMVIDRSLREVEPGAVQPADQTAECGR